METNYSIEDALNGYRWLGHESFTELVALHPDYKPGKENIEWNKEHNTFPRIWYTKKEDEVAKFIEKHDADRMVCYGLNPRPRIFKNNGGYARSAKDHEIETVQNILFDFDYLTKNVFEAQRAAFRSFVKNKVQPYYQDLGLIPPVINFTHNGYHGLFALPPIKVEECPDLSARTKKFAKEFRDDFGIHLEDLGIKFDDTFDLGRLVKMYGTAKAEEGAGISRFNGSERVEDQELRTTLLGMNITPQDRVNDRPGSPVPLAIGDKLPASLDGLLAQDEELQNVWNGRGKPDKTDTSRSGYDFSLVYRLVGLGETNFDDLATVLALRPEGAVQNSGKGESYIRRTIANAIEKALVK